MTSPATMLQICWVTSDTIPRIAHTAPTPMITLDLSTALRIFAATARRFRQRIGWLLW